MIELNLSILENLPEAAVYVVLGRITAINPMAAHYLPQLEIDGPVPGYLDLPRYGPKGVGTFTAGRTTYAFSRTDTGEGQLFLFHPAPQTSLTDLQLEGTIRQMRQLMAEFLTQIGPMTEGGEGKLSTAARENFSKSYHRMFRLLNNLDFVTSAAGPDGIPFRPSVLDLAGLCRQIARDAGQLLQQDTHLEYRSDLPSLLIQGDIPLLQRMLLGLISNSVQTMRGGVVLLSLRRQGDRAVLSLTDSGERPSDRQLAALLQQDTDQAIPQPGQGAGLGLSVVRHIAALHRGTMLVEWGEKAPDILISLPAGAQERLAVRTPEVQQDGGLSPLLVELSDVLPPQLFGQEGLD